MLCHVIKKKKHNNFLFFNKNIYFHQLRNKLAKIKKQNDSSQFLQLMLSKIFGKFIK